MEYLLDTHTAIWALEENERLSPSVAAIVGDRSNFLCISIASAWEIAIKSGIGKLKYEGGAAAFLAKLRSAGVDIVGIEDAHVSAVEKLPLLHRDPFDRLLVATAITEGMTILTIDENIHKYNVNCIW